MIEVKNDFVGTTGEYSGLNLDDSPFVVPKKCYIDALNITRDALEGSNDKVITNMIGNQLVSYSYPSGTSKVIGSYPFTLRNTVIFFRWNINNFHGIYEYNHTSRVITKILESLTDTNGIDILNFTENGKITSINIYPRNEGDLLFFLDSLGRPTGLDITQFKAGAYTPVTRTLIDVAKVPPAIQPSCVYYSDTFTNSNNLTNRLFRFKYRWIFDDFTKSTFSPISIVPLPPNILSDTFTNILTNNNLILLSLNTGDKNVKSVEIGMSFVNGTNNWSDFQSVSAVAKTTIGIQQITALNVVATVTTVITNFTQTGIYIGTIINIYLTNGSDVLIATYVTANGDTLASITGGLAASMTLIGIATLISDINNVLSYSFNNAIYSFSRIDITPSVTDVDNVNFTYYFYNDSTYPTIDINESILLFDNVPLFAGAQDFVNGNVLDYGNITEGYNKDTTANSIITIKTYAATGITGYLFATPQAIDFDGSHAFCPLVFTGSPVTGTIINLIIRRRSDGVEITAGTYTTVVGDTANSIVNNFNTTATGTSVSARSGNTVTFSILRSTYEALPNSNDWITTQIIIPATAPANQSIATFKWSTQRNIGRAYFDQDGRTNGIIYTDKIFFPAYAEDVSHNSLLPYINYKIYDIPPSWAYSFGFYLTQINTLWIFWETGFVQHDIDYFYFDVTSFVTNATDKPTTAQVCSYTFQSGDRIRLIRNQISNVVYDTTYDALVVGLVVEPTINGVTQTSKQFIKIKNVEPFTSGISVDISYVIELYRPIQQTANTSNQVYYEFANNYTILDPTLSTRRHSGQVSNQVIGQTPAEFNFYSGDAYFRARKVDNVFNIMDLNFVDYIISAVSSVDGRPNIIDTNAKQQTFGATIRYGQSYQANTNINGFNRFYPNDLLDVDLTFGYIVRLKTRDRYQKVFQQFKIGVIPLYAELTKDGSGNISLIVTDKLLNPVQYRVGVFGLSDGSSLASWHFADYGCDTAKAIIWRDSNDGVEPISELYKVDSWATINLPLRTGDTKIYGAIDPKKNEYIIALEAFTTQLPYFYFSASGLNSITGSGFFIISSEPFTVDWGDGTIDSFSAGTQTPSHTYLTPYTGIIKVSCADLSSITSFTIGSDNNISNNVSPLTGALSILVSEINKLSSLTVLRMYESMFTDGMAATLPSSITDITLRDTNLSGNVSDLPHRLTRIDIEGANTLTGNINNLPATMTYLILKGYNTLSGDVIDLPSAMTIFDVYGNNTVTGDINNVPKGVTECIIQGANTISGDIINSPTNVVSLNITGLNILVGDIATIPSTTQVFAITGYNTVHGNIASLPSLVDFIQLGGNCTVTGDIAHLPNPVRYVFIVSNVAGLTYTASARTWSSTMNSVIFNASVTPLTSTMVDNILIELAAQATTWINDKRINLTGSNAARTAESNAAVTTLTGRSVIVLTN